jgi:flagellar biosynthetic protein FlhB
MAPICIAKGADLIALTIREVALEHEIPIIENKPLARLLYDTVEIDQVVPVEHWAIVAEIISFVFDLKAKKAGKAPVGSVLRTTLN